MALSLHSHHSEPSHLSIPYSTPSTSHLSSISAPTVPLYSPCSPLLSSCLQRQIPPHPTPVSAPTGHVLPP